jgi:hypothetical protein
MSLLEADRRNQIDFFAKKIHRRKKLNWIQRINCLQHFTEHREKKTLERKTGSGQKSALPDSKVRARLKAETQGRSAKSFRSL